MITMNLTLKTVQELITTFRTERDCKRFIKELDEEYNTPLSTMQTSYYIKLLNQAQTKLHLLRLHGPS